MSRRWAPEIGDLRFHGSRRSIYRRFLAQRPVKTVSEIAAPLNVAQLATDGVDDGRPSYPNPTSGPTESGAFRWLPMIR